MVVVNHSVHEDNQALDSLNQLTRMTITREMEHASTAGASLTVPSNLYQVIEAPLQVRCHPAERQSTANCAFHFVSGRGSAMSHRLSRGGSPP